MEEMEEMVLQLLKEFGKMVTKEFIKEIVRMTFRSLGNKKKKG